MEYPMRWEKGVKSLILNAIVRAKVHNFIEKEDFNMCFKLNEDFKDLGFVFKGI